ncbi:hypothetical protein [Rhizobium sp. CG5]|uniref:hypothetical protein n=1 Tax=Rhizobium sp. CG5 TaxID=2726076 RepID=UPI002033F03C|nr:hypothetical protein [Rhizobium sp. CG5]
MHNLRSIAIALIGLALFAAAAVVTVSLTLLAGAVLTTVLAARMLSLRAKPVPVRAKPQTQPMRVWNDGRGTIIDL